MRNQITNPAINDQPSLPPTHIAPPWMTPCQNPIKVLSDTNDPLLLNDSPERERGIKALFQPYNGFEGSS